MTTIKDVAAEAGVSISTVSRVMNKGGPASTDTEHRVLDVARRLGYHPNNLAAGLRTRTTRTVGLVVNNIYNAFYAGVAQGVEDVCRQHGYSLILCNSGLNPEQERHYLEMLEQRSADGIIISPCSQQGKRAILRATQAGMAVVQVNRELDGLAVDTVVADNFRASYDAVEHLIALGHRRIATIAGPESVSTGKQRLAGFTAAMQVHGLTVPPDYVQTGDFHSESGRQAIQALLELKEPPTALVAANNEMAAGAMRVIRERGIAIPGTLSFITIDDPDWAEFVTPSLTVVRQPVYAIGVAAANQLMARLNGTAMNEPIRAVLTPTLVVRDSTGAPPVA